MKGFLRCRLGRSLQKHLQESPESCMGYGVRGKDTCRLPTSGCDRRMTLRRPETEFFRTL